MLFNNLSALGNNASKKPEPFTFLKPPSGSLIRLNFDPDEDSLFLPEATVRKFPLLSRILDSDVGDPQKSTRGLDLSTLLAPIGHEEASSKIKFLLALHAVEPFDQSVLSFSEEHLFSAKVGVEILDRADANRSHEAAAAATGAGKRGTREQS